MIDIDQIDRNFTHVTVAGVGLYFSYKTIIAFVAKGKKVVHTNDWSRTTGKHLNYIDGGSAMAKRERVSADVFKAQWQELAEPLFAAMQIGNLCGGMFDSLDRIRTRRRRAIGKLRT